MRVLIVGCGYVGLKVGADLVGQGHQVWGLRRSEKENALIKAAGIQPIKADITASKSFPQDCPQYDWVVHCVSSSGGGAAEYEQTYFTGTRNLLDFFGSRPPGKLVYTSSTSVYGQTDGSWVDEESPAEPTTATAQVLLRTEELLLAEVRRNSFPAVVLRVAGIYGPARTHWLDQVQTGRARIDGDGGRFINMVHRDDVTGAIIAALFLGAAGRVYNVVDDQPVTQSDLLRWIASRLKQPVPPAADSIQGSRKRGSTSKRISNRRLKEELSYALRFPTFKQGFKAVLLG
jgi:nucleoside-diphosphate-sugar epimerase